MRFAPDNRLVPSALRGFEFRSAKARVSGGGEERNRKRAVSKAGKTTKKNRSRVSSQSRGLVGPSEGLARSPCPPCRSPVALPRRASRASDAYPQAHRRRRAVLCVSSRAHNSQSGWLHHDRDSLSQRLAPNCAGKGKRARRLPCSGEGLS